MAGGRLTALKVTKEKSPGMYGDGGGLYLQIARRLKVVDLPLSVQRPHQQGWEAAGARDGFGLSRHMDARRGP
jgi:hypothetical protein